MEMPRLQRLLCCAQDGRWAGMTKPKRLAFLGLGVMGAPMAGHLARAGHRVTVYNRTVARADEWVARHSAQGLDVASAASPGEAAQDQDVVLTCVGNDEDLAGVALGEAGALAAMTPGALFVDHTTVSPAIARRIARDAEMRGVLVLDAPVSGGQAGAENGKLAIMCGGSVQAMDSARPILEAYAARIVHVGEAGSGQAAKAVNQICIAGTLAGLSEGVRFAQAAGLDLHKVFEAISGGAAQSWQMDNRWSTMTQGKFDFGFAIDWMRKDLAIALEEALAKGLDLPITRAVDGYYAEVQAIGGGRQDTSALIRHLPKAGR
jgi:3-hydroxyisobutyrate dehydrogenase